MLNKPQKTINIPETELKAAPLTKKEIEHGAKLRVSRISREFLRGFRFIKKYPKSVTFFGSARFHEDNPHYIQARAIAHELAKLGFAVVTGGGPGIMEAANRGAKEAGGASVGLNIRLPKEQVLNPYVTDSVDFYYFFSRKVTLSFSAEAYLYFPGGFGTLDEFFEIITLIQTKKIPKVPVLLVGSDFWEPMRAFIEETLYEKHHTISPEDRTLFTITDDNEKIIEIVKNAPMRDE